MPQSIPQIRRRNLLLQLSLFTHHAVDSGQENGAATAFAARIGVHKSLLSKLKGEGPSARDVSDAMARQIESALGLPGLWMDAEHEDAPVTPAEMSLMQLTLQASRTTDAKGRTYLRRLLKRLAANSESCWHSLLLEDAAHFSAPASSKPSKPSKPSKWGSDDRSDD